MKKQTFLTLLSALLLTTLLAACGSPPPPAPRNTDTLPAADTSAPSSTTTSGTNATGTVNIKAEVWTDNWFAFYLGETLIKEDSVPITTERSFNKETFTFQASYPLQLNFIVKDYMANNTGLEYIGTERQQMGDGGFIAQFTNADTGELIAATNADWSELVIQQAPLDTTCAKQPNPVAGTAPCTFTLLDEPGGWKTLSFDASAWAKATIYTEGQVGPKDGYYEVQWNPSAKLIWGPDLKMDNTILYRRTVTQP